MSSNSAKAPLVAVNCAAICKSQDSSAKAVLSELSAVRSLAEANGMHLLKAVSLMRGRSNQGGIDIVGFTPRPGHTVDDHGGVRVPLIDGKAINAQTLHDVSALTGERLRSRGSYGTTISC